MDRRPLSGALRRGLAGFTLIALTASVSAGCSGADAVGPTTGVPAESAGPVTQSTTLPVDWPAGLTFPDGATVTFTTSTDEGMSALFSAPQDLATLRVWFDGVVTGLGYQRKTDDSFVDMLSTSWSNGDVTISVTATPVADRTSGLLLVEPED